MVIELISVKSNLDDSKIDVLGNCELILFCFPKISFTWVWGIATIVKQMFLFTFPCMDF